MSWDAANHQRTREGAHYAARTHATDKVRPSRAKPKDELDDLATIIDRGYRTFCRK
jgi:hypothetical protein